VKPKQHFAIDVASRANALTDFIIIWGDKLPSTRGVGASMTSFSHLCMKVSIRFNDDSHTTGLLLSNFGWPLL
jgi:hypothetical protein